MPNTPQPAVEMTPAEVYAALYLLSYGLKAALDDAKAEADAFRRQTRSKQLETDFGLVYLTRTKDSIQVPDEAALLAWCEEHSPESITRTVSSPAVTALKTQRWAIVGDDVIDTRTGEVVEVAAVQRGGVENLTVRATPQAKAYAAAAMAGRVPLRLAVDFAGIIHNAARRAELGEG